MVSIRLEFLILCARAREKTKHFLSNAHYFNPTRSMKENKKRKDKASDAATVERRATLEKACRSLAVRRNASRRTRNINITGPISFTCSCPCRFSSF